MPYSEQIQKGERACHLTEFQTAELGDLHAQSHDYHA